MTVKKRDHEAKNKAYRERMTLLGWKRITLVVPDDEVVIEELRAAAEKARRSHEKELGL